MHLRQCRKDKGGCGRVFKTVLEHTFKCDDCISKHAKEKGRGHKGDILL